MIYLAGPIRGKPAYNIAAFIEAEEWIRLVRPLELGYDNGYITRELQIFNPPVEDIRKDFPPFTRTLLYYMKRDIPSLLNSHNVVLLEGWKESKGASLEAAIAMSVNIPIWELTSQKEGGKQLERLEPFTIEMVHGAPRSDSYNFGSVPGDNGRGTGNSLSVSEQGNNTISKASERIRRAGKKILVEPRTGYEYNATIYGTYPGRQRKP